MADPQQIPAPPPGYMIDPSDPTRAIPIAAQQSAFGDRPIIRTGPTPQDNLNMQHTQQEITAFPTQQESVQTNIQQNKASIQNQHFNQVQGLRQEYNALPEVKTYGVALQSLASALKAPDSPQGDLSIIYNYAKAADPGSVVREGEMDMANATASLPEQYKADAQKLTQGKRLPPQVRTGLIEAMRQSVSGLRQSYDQQRTRYEQEAQKNGFDPTSIIGQPLYDAVRPLEENYVRAHGGTPKDPNAPEAASTLPTSGDIGQKQDPRLTELNPEQKTAYDAFWKANPNATPEQLQHFGTSIGLNIPEANAKDIVTAKQSGRGVSSDVQVVPDISDLRGGNNTSTQDAINATARGVADTVSFGAADKLIALGDTVTKGGTYAGNLSRQYAISDYDQANHPFTRLGGQVLGGAVLPMGEMSSPGQIAAKGSAFGGAYGLGSSRTAADIVPNVLAGAAVGAAVPYAFGKLFKPKAGSIDPLVDPVTGELNQPMVNSMTPAERVATMRDYGMQTVTPGMAGGRTARVLEQGLNNVPGSAGVMEDVNAQASGELRRSMQGVAQQFGQSKTLNEGGAELQRGANEWMNRADRIASRLYDKISIPPQTKANLNTTTATLQNLSDVVQSNPDLAAEVKDPVMAKYLDAIQKGGLDWQGLKQFRTFVGAKAGEFRFSQDARKDGYQALYGALSEDMRNTAASLGPRQLQEFARANSFFAAKEQRVEGGLVRILGNDAKARPELAAAAVQAMTKGGKTSGDIKTLSDVRASTIRSGAWDEIASTMIHLGGQPANSEGRAFSPQTFVNWYADMSEPARKLLFKPELRRSLDGFVAMNQQLGRIKGLTNTSNTTPTMIGSGVIAAGGLAAVSHPMALVGIAAGGVANFGMAKLWTNPKFVSLLTGVGRAAARGNKDAVQTRVSNLAKFAAKNPEFSEPVQAILREISNDNFVGPLAASPNSDQKQGDQQP